MDHYELMKNILIGFVILAILSLGIIFGLLLVNQNQIFKQKAATPTGTATVDLSPATSTFPLQSPQTITVNFNTHGIAISGITVRLTYSNLSASASNIQIDQGLLSGGAWSCPTKIVSSNGSTDEIDIVCANSSAAGYSNNSDTPLAEFTLTASQVPLENPLTISFDPVTTKITQESDGSDIALTPSATGSYTITSNVASSPTATPLVIVASPTATPTGGPTSAPQCGTVCRTNADCPSSMVCYVGACRNPNCTQDSSCLCAATPTPTLAAGSTASPSASMPPIPVTGFDLPTVIAGGAGVSLLLVAAAALIL